MDYELNKKAKVHRARELAAIIPFDEEKYEYDESFIAAKKGDFNGVHTTFEMLNYLKENKKCELDAKVIGVSIDKDGTKSVQIKTVTKEKFVESFKNQKMKESGDPFSSDFGSTQAGVNAGLVGDDFVPLIGGPLYKNLYYYQDYIRMHSQAFYAYHHDPVARAIVDITTNFTLGRGFHIDCEDTKALAYWRAVEEANDLQNMIRQFSDELTIYGENMIWCLPDNQTKITWDLRADQKVPHGVLPRFRLVDPSNIVEIITYPEDITRKLAYVWLAPTQYQTYSSVDGDPSQDQPSLKFIYRQIPANEMLHYKINCASNEKRGRSDFYAVLGYMKRLRDSVNYAMLSHQKQAAWAIDTEIDGDQTDIDAYVAFQQSLGTVAPAGSENVHGKKIKRTFMSPENGHAGKQEIFEWCWSMISAGTLIPVSYFGTHMSGGQTKASAIVATEPVAKKFEMRQQVLTNVLTALWNWSMKVGGYKGAKPEITFPEIITQDRSAKLKDLALCEMQGWINKERAATIAAKELSINEYDYDTEFGGDHPDPAEQPAATVLPLSNPGAAEKPTTSTSAVTSDQKRKANQNRG